MEFTNTTLFCYYTVITLMTAIFTAVMVRLIFKMHVEPDFKEEYYEDNESDEESDYDGDDDEEIMKDADAAPPAEENEVQIISTESESGDDCVELTQNILDNAIMNILLKAKKGKTAKDILIKIREILPSITKHDVNSRLYTFKNKKLVAKDKSSVPLWISS